MYSHYNSFMYYTDLDKGGYPPVNIFLFLHENICCGYSLEAPQNMFLWRNKKNINIFGFGLKKAPYMSCIREVVI